MTKLNSPLRFPGSKSRVLHKILPFLDVSHSEYREPFLGGGSIFLGKSLAEKNWINDIDPYLYSFFYMVKNNPIDLCLYIQELGTPNIERWHALKTSNINEESMLEQAYKFLFMNRVNYSGLFRSTPIGGLKQNSKWKIDCRWNETLICKRIIEASSKLEHSRISNLDFEPIITAPGNDVLLMLDPPYYQQGHKLYPFSMNVNDHKRLADLLKNTNHKFLLTIDDCQEVREIYYHDDFIFTRNSWKYTVNSAKKDNNGKELFISNFEINNNSNVSNELILVK